MTTVCHFEIPAKDMERARDFYSKLFEWKIDKFEGDTAAKEPYMMIETSKGSGTIFGGIMPKMAEEHNITIYFDVSSVDETAKKVDELGGKICVPKMAVPGMGWFACCNDPEGNTFAIWQEDKEAAPTKEQQEWTEKKGENACC